MAIIYSGVLDEIRNCPIIVGGIRLLVGGN